MNCHSNSGIGALSRLRFVIPAKAGIQGRRAPADTPWAPAFAGVTIGNLSGIGRFPRRFRGFEDVLDRDRRGQGRLAAVLIGDLGGELDLRLAAVERVDDGGVFLGDKAAPDLARAGDLVVVGVEFLVEQQKAPDAARPRAKRR